MRFQLLEGMMGYTIRLLASGLFGLVICLAMPLNSNAQESSESGVTEPKDLKPPEPADPSASPQTEEPAQTEQPEGETEQQSEEETEGDDETTQDSTPSEDSGPSARIDDIEIPEVLRDLSVLPFPARRMHELLLEAAKSGDIEKLRPYIGYGEDVTMLSLGGIDEDPIAFLKSLSGDPEGHEVLAILTEVLESGFVHLDKDSEQELFVWPYFFAYPLDKLTADQRVELFTIVTYGDYEDMQSFGAYIFYRVGITPQGRWRFFVAGD